MNITILSIDIKTMPTARGSYQVADVAYKNNTFQGKVEGKKVMSFGATAKAFASLAEASPGESYNISIVKNDKGYNDWVELTRGDASVAAATSATPAASKSAPTKTTYETPEERALRQVLIVRQSSVSSAVAMLVAGAKTPPKTEEVLLVAKQFVDFVFGVASDPQDSSDFPDVE